MRLRTLALLLGLVAVGASAQPSLLVRPDFVAPHLRPLDSDAQTREQVIALDDSTYLSVLLPAPLVRPSEFDGALNRRCLGGHWALDALVSVRMAEQVGHLNRRDTGIHWPVLLARDERPVVCVEPWVSPPGPSDPLWITHPGDTLAVTAIRHAVERCAPDPDPGFGCGLPQIVDRVLTGNGVEAIAITMRYIDGYADSPEIDAHTMGPFWTLQTRSTRYPFLYLHAERLLTWIPDQAQFTDDETTFVRRMIENSQIVEADEPIHELIERSR